MTEQLGPQLPSVRFGADENQVRHTFRHIDRLGLDRDAVSTKSGRILLGRDPFPREQASPELSWSEESCSNTERLLWLMVLSTSVVSRVLDMSAWRKLRKEEADLITAMVGNNPRAGEILASLSDRLVEDMQDGGMGSLRFRGADHLAPRFGKQIAEAEFTDDDGILASAAVNLDETGELFELDIWKVDFSPLKRYPRPDELRVKPAS